MHAMPAESIPLARVLSLEAGFGRPYASLQISDAACEALVSPHLDIRRLIKPMLRP